MDEGDAIGFHWDRDEVLADANPPKLVHPHIATVTYFTDYGAPTVVLEQVPVESRTGPVEALVVKGAISYPKAGKHIGFDGR